MGVPVGPEGGNAGGGVLAHTEYLFRGRRDAVMRYSDFGQQIGDHIIDYNQLTSYEGIIS